VDDRRVDALAKTLAARLPRRAALGLLAALGPAAGAAAGRPAPPRPGGKDLVCHKGRTTLAVGGGALRAHLAHGDTKGRAAGRPGRSSTTSG
jgi:hypothetical protein